jgi:hypothetical protein
MKKIILFLAFTIVALIANAQVSGYLGKRFMIGYSNYFFPGIKGPGPRVASPADEYATTINNVSCLNVEYVYAQQRMVCFTAQYLRTGIAYNRGLAESPFDLDGGSSYPYPDAANYVGDFYTPALLTSVNLGIGMKVFKQGYIAPLGRYRKFEFLFMMEKIKYDNTHFISANYYYGGSPSTPVLYTAGEGVYKYKNVSLTYTIGKQQTFFEKIILDYGIRFGCTPARNIISVLNGNDALEISGYYRKETRKRIFREQLINIHLGIGFLAF